MIHREHISYIFVTRIAATTVVRDGEGEREEKGEEEVSEADRLLVSLS